MKSIISSLAIAVSVAASAGAQVWINEVLSNPYGSDTGNEHFELRGSPNMSLAGIYLLSLEGQGNGTGDVNQFFDLGGFSMGVNGYLFARQNLSPYTQIAPGAALIENTIGTGWGTNGNNTIGYQADGTGLNQQLDLENSATTILLVNIGAGIAPTLTLDLDTDNDGLLDLPVGWAVLDSVGIMDGNAAVAGDRSYGAVTLRGRVQGATEWLGTAPPGTTIIDVPGNSPSSAGAFYVARKGESTGSTADDWFGAILQGSGGTLNQTFGEASDPFYQGKRLSDMVFGGENPVPEPGALALLGLGGCLLFLRRRSS